MHPPENLRRNVGERILFKEYTPLEYFYITPTDHINDNSRKCTSWLFGDVYRLLNVHKSLTATYNPQTNGQVRGFHRTNSQP